MKNISIFLLTSLFAIILLNSIGCGNSNELIKKKSEQFWEMSSYFPKSYSKIVGTYEHSSGFDGEYLKLNPDSTFFLRQWYDIFDPTDPYIGHKGKYSIKADTLTLKIESFAIDTNVFKKLFPKINNKLMDRLIQDSLKVHNQRYKNGIDAIRDTNIDLYRKLVNQNKFNIKRVGEYILLVRYGFKDLFLDEILKDYNYPQCVSCKNKMFSYFFTKKIIDKKK